MPTPHGTRGGMAFGAEELRVLRRALALAAHSRPAGTEDVRDCLRLAESLDEAVREGARLRAFLLADLARYRAALPGTAVAYLTLLEECLDAGHRPTSDDVTALRALRGNPVAASLLLKARATVPTARTAPAAPRMTAGPDVPGRPAARTAHPHPAAVTGPAGRTARETSAAPAAASAGSVGCAVVAGPAVWSAYAQPAAVTGPAGQAAREAAGRPAAAGATASAASPAPVAPDAPAGPVAGVRGPGSAVAQGLVGAGGEEEPGEEPAAEPGERPAPGRPEAPEPGRRPVPTPGEVFPRRKPGAPGGKPRQRLAVAQPSGAPRRRPVTLDSWTTSPHSFRRS